MSINQFIRDQETTLEKNIAMEIRQKIEEGLSSSQMVDYISQRYDLKSATIAYQCYYKQVRSLKVEGDRNEA